MISPHLNILTSEYQLSTGSEPRSLVRASGSLDQLLKMFSPSSVSGLWQNLPCDWSIVKMTASDWSIMRMMASDWSIVRMMASDWSIVRMMASDWLNTDLC